MSAIIGLGTNITVADGVAGAQQAFAACKELTIPASDLQYVDSSYINQPDSYKRYTAGLLEPGDASATLQYNSADLARVYALRGVSKDWVITFPDGSTVAFAGILQKGESTATVDGILEIKISIRATGAITFTPA